MEAPVITTKFVVANNDNARWISSICAAAIQDTYGQAVPGQQLQQYIDTHFTVKRIVDESNSKVNEGLFAFLKDNPVGYMKLSTGKRPAAFEGIKALEIRNLYVLKEPEGTGAALSLLERSLQLAGSRRFNVIWTRVWENDAAALRFYEGHGFTRFDTEPVSFGAEAYTHVLLKKELALL
jgi:GNAT superfamily N-acetyltransferase